MKLVPALEYDKLRQDAENWNCIYVHKEGKFYHVYEWSAWLLKNFVCTEEFQKERGDAKILAANRYKTKDNEYIMLGFPVESLSKYVPQYQDLEAMEGGDLKLSIELPLNGEETCEMLLETFEAWKANCPLKENKVKGRKDITNGEGQASMLGRSGMFHILSQVLSYPVERTTPVENVEFISKLKQQVASLL